MINVSFFKHLPIADEIMETDRESFETTQDDKIRTDKSYSPDEGISETQSTVKPDGHENNKKGIDIMSPGLAALDCAKISDQNATKLAAVIDALELDPNNYNISRSAIRQVCMVKMQRSNSGRSAGSSILSCPLWDGKLLSGLTGLATVDRLPVWISGAGTQQLLSVSKLKSQYWSRAR